MQKYKTCQYQPDELNDNLIEINHEGCSYTPPPRKKYIDGFRWNNVNILRIKRAFFINFKGLSVFRNCFRSESGLSS